MKRILLTAILVLSLAGIADACQLSGTYLFVLTDRTVGTITFGPGPDARWSSDLGGLSGGYEVFRDCGLMIVLPDGQTLVFGSANGDYFTLRAGLWDGRRIGFGFRLQ